MKLKCSHGVVDWDGNFTETHYEWDAPDDYFEQVADAMAKMPKPTHMIVSQWAADLVEDELRKMGKI